MKRTFTTIVCALLLVAMLAGCGSSASSFSQLTASICL